MTGPEVTGGAVRASVVLFDLDDTLIQETQTVPRILRAACRALEHRYGLAAEMVAAKLFEVAVRRWQALPTGQLTDALGISAWEGLWASFDGPHPGFAGLREQRDGFRRDTWSETLATFDIADAALAAELSTAIQQESGRYFTEVPGACRLVRDLVPERRVAVVTNGIPELQRRKLAALGLEDVVTTMVASGELGVGKPDPRIFAAALRRLDCSPADCVMIGNSLQADVGGARAAGITAVWLDADTSAASPITAGDLAAAAPMPVPEPDFRITGLDQVRGLPPLRG